MKKRVAYRIVDDVGEAVERFRREEGIPLGRVSVRRTMDMVYFEYECDPDTGALEPYDPEADIAYLEQIANDIRAGRARLAEHDPIEVEDDWEDEEAPILYHVGRLDWQ